MSLSKEENGIMIEILLGFCFGLLVCIIAKIYSWALHTDIRKLRFNNSGFRIK
jgi:hypothetical protein